MRIPIRRLDIWTTPVFWRTRSSVVLRHASRGTQLCDKQGCVPSRHGATRSAATVSSVASAVDTSTQSARRRFKEIPVHSSILEYIRSIGVGIAPRKTLQRNQRSRLQLDDQRRPRGRTSARMNRLRANDNTAPPSSGQPSMSSPTSYSWMPPPPFGPHSLPVQVIASVGPESVQLLDAVDTVDKRGTTTALPSTASHPDMVVSVHRHTFPKNESGVAEIALAGRSNVGKSTLLNALLYGNKDHSAVTTKRQRGRVPPNVKLVKGVKATMSSKPGETRHITFYKLQHVSTAASNESNDSAHANSTRVTSRRLHLVDLPGYGFAYAKPSHAAAYRALMADYVLHRKTLKRVLVLLDARHGMKQADFDFFNLLQDESRGSHGTEIPPIQLVLTKCDLVEQVDLARRVAQVRQQLSDILRREPSQLPIMLVSARPGVGYNNVDRHDRALGGVLELQKELSALALPKQSQSIPTTRSKA